jgi:hypothetical protein
MWWTMTEVGSGSPCWLFSGSMLLGSMLLALPARAPEIQLTGPLAGAPAVYTKTSERDRRIVMPSGHLGIVASSTNELSS